MRRWLSAMVLGICAHTVYGDEVTRPLAQEPWESLHRTATLVVDNLKKPSSPVGERTGSESEVPGPRLSVANLENLSAVVEELASSPAASSGPSDLGLASPARVTFGRLGDRTLASLGEGDSDEPVTLEQVRRSENYFLYRDYVVNHTEQWESLRKEAGFVEEARRLFGEYAPEDPNHRNRELFARFLSGLDPRTPTSATATPVRGSAEKTH